MAAAATFSFTGDLDDDNAVRLFEFLLAATSDTTLRTFRTD